MDDDIELPPLPPVLGAPGMNLWIDDLRRAAVLADRERRAKQQAKQEAKPVVHSKTKGVIIILGWTDDGKRVWIESERNRGLARRLRVVAEVGYTAPTDAALRDAADALDGGVR